MSPALATLRFGPRSAHRVAVLVITAIIGIGSGCRWHGPLTSVQATSVARATVSRLEPVNGQIRYKVRRQGRYWFVLVRCSGCARIDAQSVSYAYLVRVDEYGRAKVVTRDEF